MVRRADKSVSDSESIGVMKDGFASSASGYCIHPHNLVDPCTTSGVGPGKKTKQKYMFTNIQMCKVEGNFQEKKMK